MAVLTASTAELSADAGGLQSDPAAAYEARNKLRKGSEAASQQIGPPQNTFEHLPEDAQAPQTLDELTPVPALITQSVPLLRRPGLVHSRGPFPEGKTTSHPKPTCIRAAHHGGGPAAQPLEIQVRTTDAPHRKRHAAHWRYQTGSPGERPLPFLKNVLECKGKPQRHQFGKPKTDLTESLCLTPK